MSVPLRVLIVEDSEDDALLEIEEIRQGGIDPVWERVETAQAMDKALSHQAWDIIIADYSLPHFSGLGALELAQQRDPDLPLILISGVMREEEAVDAMRAGARDFISKSSMYRLAPAIARETREATVRRDQRQAEEALREAQYDLRRAQAIAHIGSWRLNVRKNELLWSDETYRIFGIPEGTPMTYEAFLAAIHPDDLEYVDRKWTAALQGEQYDIEHRILVGDTIKWVRETAELEIDEHGGLLGGFGTVQDITERKRAEQTLERTLDEAQRDRRFVSAIERVSEAALSPGPLEEVLQTVAARIREGMGSHSCTLFLLDEERQELEAVAECNIPEVVGFRIPAGEGYAGEILRKGRSVYIQDALNDPLVVNPHVKRLGAKSLLGAPLIGREGALGVVYVDELVVREFTPEEHRLLEILAARTALVIEAARLYDRLAKSRNEVQSNFSLLQRSLLPPEGLAVGPGYRMAGAYLSPFGLEIGGDFYDVFDTESEKHAILIGDVAGKGVGAVSLATATRSTIRALLYDIPSPGEALTHANSVLCSQDFLAGESVFVTAFVVVIDPATGQFRYAGAGHPPPAIHRGADGTVEFLETGGPPLRIALTMDFSESSSLLLPGDRLILYTDGLSEARRNSELFGLDGVRRILQEHGGHTPEDLVARLIEAASEWAGGNITDDTAIVVVEREVSSAWQEVRP